MSDVIDKCSHRTSSTPAHLLAPSKCLSDHYLSSALKLNNEVFQIIVWICIIHTSLVTGPGIPFCAPPDLFHHRVTRTAQQVGVSIWTDPGRPEVHVVALSGRQGAAKNRSLVLCRRRKNIPRPQPSYRLPDTLPPMTTHCILCTLHKAMYATDVRGFHVRVRRRFVLINTS